MPHLRVIVSSAAGLSPAHTVAYNVGDSIYQIKRLISSAKEFDSMLSKEVPLSVFFDARELEDKHTGLLDGAAVVVSNTIAQREHLTALGYSYWPDSLRRVLSDACGALESGNAPQLANNGEGATYFLLSADPPHGFIACFKPRDEEAGAPRNPRRAVGSLGQPSMRTGILSGEGFVREVAAFVLDHGGFSGVPPTALVTGRHAAFNNGRQRHADSDSRPLAKLGAFQQFVNDGTMVEDFGTPKQFPDEEVWKIAILDLRLMNLDRNGENILVKIVEDSGGRRLTLVPIDHGACLPSDLGVSSFDWIWINWPQLKKPLSDDVKRYVAALNADDDITRLQALFGHHIRPQCLMTLRITYLLLQRGVARGLSLFEIASLMCRADVAADPLTDRSPLERAVLAAAHLATHAMHSVPTHVASRLRSGFSPPLRTSPLIQRSDMLPVLQQGLPDLGLPPSALPDRSIGLQAASLSHTLARQLSTQPTFTACPPAVAAWWAARVAAASSERPTARIRCRHVSELGLCGLSTSALLDRGLDVWIALAFCSRNARSVEPKHARHSAATFKHPAFACDKYRSKEGTAVYRAQQLARGVFDSRRGVPSSWAIQFGLSALVDADNLTVSSIAVGIAHEGRLALCLGTPADRGVLLEGEINISRGIRAALASAFAATIADLSHASVETISACSTSVLDLLGTCTPITAAVVHNEFAPKSDIELITSQTPSAPLTILSPYKGLSREAQFFEMPNVTGSQTHLQRSATCNVAYSAASSSAGLLNDCIAESSTSFTFAMVAAGTSLTEHCTDPDTPNSDSMYTSGIDDAPSASSIEAGLSPLRESQLFNVFQDFGTRAGASLLRAIHLRNAKMCGTINQAEVRSASCCTSPVSTAQDAAHEGCQCGSGACLCKIERSRASGFTDTGAISGTCNRSCDSELLAGRSQPDAGRPSRGPAMDLPVPAVRSSDYSGTERLVDTRTHRSDWQPPAATGGDSDSTTFMPVSVSGPGTGILEAVPPADASARALAGTATSSGTGSESAAGGGGGSWAGVGPSAGTGTGSRSTGAGNLKLAWDSVPVPVAHPLPARGRDSDSLAASATGSASASAAPEPEFTHWQASDSDPAGPAGLGLGLVFTGPATGSLSASGTGTSTRASGNADSTTATGSDYPSHGSGCAFLEYNFDSGASGLQDACDRDALLCASVVQPLQGLVQGSLCQCVSDISAPRNVSSSDALAGRSKAGSSRLECTSSITKSSPRHAALQFQPAGPGIKRVGRLNDESSTDITADATLSSLRSDAVVPTVAPPGPPSRILLGRSTTYSPDVARTHVLDAARGLVGPLPSLEGTPIARATLPLGAPVIQLARHTSESGSTTTTAHGGGAATDTISDGNLQRPESYDQAFLAYLSRLIDDLVSRALLRR